MTTIGVITCAALAVAYLYIGWGMFKALLEQTGHHAAAMVLALLWPVIVAAILASELWKAVRK